MAKNEDVDTVDFLARVKLLSSLGFHVLISEFFRYFRVRQYFARYTRKPVAIVTDVNGFTDIVREDLYEGLSGGMLEGLGQLFPRGTTVYVYPNVDEGGQVVTLDTMPIADHLRPLVSYLRECDWVIPIDEADPRRLERKAGGVLDDLRHGRNRWRDDVPLKAQDVIAEQALFGYRAAD